MRWAVDQALRVCAALVGAVVMLVVTADCGQAPTTLSTTSVAAGGKLVYVGLDGLFTFDLTRRTSSKLATFPDGTFASAPSVSPDGSLIAFSLSHYGIVGSGASGSDLYVMNADGTGQRALVSGIAPADASAWSPDGQSIYVARRTPEGQDQIERVHMDGSSEGAIVRDANTPAVSPDGKRLAYMVTDRTNGTQSLWVSGSDGTSPKRLPVSADLVFVQDPRFSPNGQDIAFAAAPPPTAASAFGETPGLTALNRWLGPTVAEAHSQPYDIWLIGPDGTNLRRLTKLQAHVAYPNWSSDGRWLAFTGEPGLYLVDSSGSRVDELSQEGLPSGLSWLPN